MTHFKNQRFISSVEDAPKVGTVFQRQGTWLYCTGHSRNSWYLSQDEIDDEDLFDYEGVPVTYVYYRDATQQEIDEHDRQKQQRKLENAQNPTVQAARLRKYVERLGATTGKPDVTDLDNILFEWQPSYSGGSTYTLSTDGQRVRVVQMFAPYGDYLTDRAVSTVNIADLNKEMKGALEVLLATKK